MLKEDIAAPLHDIISTMYNLANTSFSLEDQSRGISVSINLKNYSYMNFSFSQHKEKEKGNISFNTGDFPIYAYHNSITRLTPIYDQLSFLGRHPKYATPDLLMSFSATISNVSLMLGEETLIKTENIITDKIPAEYRNDLVIFCGPVGEYFVFTIHFIKPMSSTSASAGTSNQNSNNENNLQHSSMTKSYSSSTVSQIGNANSQLQNPTIPLAISNPSMNSNNNNSAQPLSSNLAASSSPQNSSVLSSNNNFSTPSRISSSASNGNLSLMGSTSINSPILETAPASVATTKSYESPAFWRPFVHDATFPHLGKQYVVVDSVMLKTKFKTQTVILSQLKALQMLLSSISVVLSVQAEEEEEEEND